MSGTSLVPLIHQSNETEMTNYKLLTAEESKSVIKSLTDMSIVITTKSTEWVRTENKYKHLHKK